MQDAIQKGIVVLKGFSNLTYQYNPRTLIYQHQKIKLYHYHSKQRSTGAIPLLIVFATINRPEILDLFPETSFIGNLLAKGNDIYLVDWGYPKEEDEAHRFYDYVKFLEGAIQCITAKNPKEKINLLGICQGGVIALCYAALFNQIKNLILISTPIDFHTRNNLMGKLLRNLDMTMLTGNVPGKMLTNFFIGLRPFELLGKKYLRFMDNLENEAATEKFLRVEKWLYDAPDQAGAMFKEFVSDFYQQNKLIKSEIEFEHRKIDLNNLTLPILNVMAKRDAIVPMSASLALKKYVGSKDYTQKCFNAGHIGMYISEPISNQIAQTITKWLLAHS